MKNISYYVLLFLVVPMLLSGQTERIKSNSVETSLSYNYLEDLKLHVLFSFGKKQHEPFFGFEFPVNRDHTSNFGINAGYRFFPNKNQQNFDFYFLYLMQAGSRKLYPKSTINGFSLHNLLGYGFNIYLNETIFIKHHIAAGIESSWFSAYDTFNDFSLVVNFGIGIKIKNSNSRE